MILGYSLILKVVAGRMRPAKCLFETPVSIPLRTQRSIDGGVSVDDGGSRAKCHRDLPVENAFALTNDNRDRFVPGCTPARSVHPKGRLIAMKILKKRHFT